MSYKVSNNCRLCLSKKIKTVFSFKPMPIGEKYSRSKFKKKTIKYPFSVGICKKCKNVQTMEVVNDKNLWENYTYFSSQTKAISNHFKEVSKYIIKQTKLDKNHLVIDIGSNDGTLLKNFKNSGIKVLGVDPAENVVRYANSIGINTMVGKFDKSIGKRILKKNYKAKLVTAFNVFAHTSKLREMIKTIDNVLDEKGFFVFEVQYLGDILDKKILGTFFHEHMHHHSITSLKNFLEEFNFNFIDAIKVNIQKGSIIGIATKNKKLKKTKRFRNILKNENKNKYCTEKKLIEFKNFVQNSKDKIRKIVNKEKNKILCGYGAARSGPNFIINYGLDKKIDFLVDDHPMKVNKFSAFNNLKVYPTNVLNKKKINLCVIFAYLHQKKIIKKNLAYLNSGGNFLVLFPSPKIINKKNYKKFL